jgi:hypothetical protein
VAQSPPWPISAGPAAPFPPSLSPARPTAPAPPSWARARRAAQLARACARPSGRGPASARQPSFPLARACDGRAAQHRGSPAPPPSTVAAQHRGSPTRARQRRAPSRSRARGSAGVRSAHATAPIAWRVPAAAAAQPGPARQEAGATVYLLRNRPSPSFLATIPA